VVGSGIQDECQISTAAVSSDVGMEGADCAENEGEEQAVLLVDDTTGIVTVVQPNEDGSYWRKIVRNKMIRMKEKRRMQAGKAFVAEELPEGIEGKVVSSWGPYTSVDGTAVKTGVAGLTAKAKLSAAIDWQLIAPESKKDVRAAVGSELVAAFNAIDTDKTGVISRAELGAAVRKVNPAASEEDLANMLTLADENGDDEVSLQEFLMIMLVTTPAEAAVAA